jgi:hypothetical protein
MKHVKRALVLTLINVQAVIRVQCCSTQLALQLAQRETLTTTASVSDVEVDVTAARLKIHVKCAAVVSY